jgi:hypothetical protein
MRKRTHLRYLPRFNQAENSSNRNTTFYSVLFRSAYYSRNRSFDDQIPTNDRASL